MKKITFENQTVEISNDLLKDELIDIDFNGDMMVQFKKETDNTYTAVNGMNGWGQNIASEIAGKKAIISK
ncbi:hypothetical protein [Winogradskyella forsetii]|uniref:hypothetical protein n=1 Tax=Winogradskyella forsetii TaxID=2686077 RepID=UPI0015BBB046|nr:hypothetical protein [Winogradskyella forsetii]